MPVKYDTLRLQDWRGGLNRSLSDFEIEDNQLWTAINSRLDAKAIKKWPGYAELNETVIPGAADVLSIFEFYDGSSSHILINCGTKIYEIDVSDGSFTDIVLDLVAGEPVSYAAIDRVVYMSNGTDSVWKWDGATVTTAVDDDSNSGQKVLKIASTTGLSEGQRVIINQGGAREESGEIDTISAGISVTLVDTLTYTHTGAQADVVWATASELSTLPKAKWIVVHRDKMFYAGCSGEDEDTIFFSQAGLPETIDADAEIIVYTADGDILTGMASVFGYLMLFKGHSTFRLQGARKDQLILADNLIDAHPGVGCAAHSSIAKIAGGLMFLSNEGVQATDTSVLKKQSGNVKEWLDELADANKDKACGLFDGIFYRVSYPTGSESLPNETLCIDLRTGGWCVLEYGMNAYVKTRDGHIYAAGQDGYVYTIDTGTSYNGSNITMRVETKNFVLAGPYMTNVFRKAGVHTKGSSSALELSFSVDRGESSYKKELIFAGGATFWGDLWAISTGTVTVTNGSTTVTGDGDTDFTLVAVGDSFQVDGDTVVYTVESCVPPTITLTSIYAGTGGAGKEFAVWNDDTMLWTEPSSSYKYFSLPKRLLGRMIQFQIREDSDSSDIEIYGIDLEYLPRLTRR